MHLIQPVDVAVSSSLAAVWLTAVSRAHPKTTPGGAVQKFVSIEPDDPIDPVRSELQRAGIPAADAVARMLARALAPYEQTTQHEDFVEGVIAYFSRFRTSSPREDIALLVTLMAAFEHMQQAQGSSEDVRVFNDVRKRLLDYLGDVVRDVTEAFTVVGRSREAADAMRAMELATEMYQRGLIAPSQMIDRDLLKALTPAKGGRSWENQDLERDAARLEFWCKTEPSAVVPMCVALLESEPIENLGELARGIGIALSIGVPGLPPLALDVLTRLLCRRRRLEGRADDQLLTSLCWRFAADLGEAAAAALPDDYVDLSKLAFEALGRMRTLFLGEGAAKAFGDARDYLQAAMLFALETQPNASVWDVLRRLLLALRALPVQSVPDNLWAGPESGPELMPNPWWWVPERVNWLFGRYLKRELVLDPELKKLRVELAQFCLDRLKSKKSEPGMPLEMVEPDPQWREAYVYAARELHAALGARGHRVLVWSKANDPEPRVREAADLAEDVVRREQSLPDNKSPRRVMLAAFWWLRQAHVLALGGSVDKAGAQETFQKEVRRLARH